MELNIDIKKEQEQAQNNNKINLFKLKESSFVK